MDDLFTWAERSQPACGTIADAVQAACAGLPACLPDDFRLVIQVLASHVGADLAITAPEIAAAAGLWPDMAPANRGTKVRKLLELHQDDWPWPICGDSRGYYFASTADDLTHYCASLRSRAICDLRRFATTRRHARRAGFIYLGHGRWSDIPQARTPSLA